MTDNFRWTEDLADYINVNDDLTGEGFLNVDRTKYYDFEDLDGISEQWNFKNNLTIPLNPHVIAAPSGNELQIASINDRNAHIVAFAGRSVVARACLFKHYHYHCRLDYSIDCQKKSSSV